MKQSKFHSPQAPSSVRSSGQTKRQRRHSLWLAGVGRGHDSPQCSVLRFNRDVPSSHSLSEPFMEILCNPRWKVPRAGSLVSSSVLGNIPMPVCEEFGWHQCGKRYWDMGQSGFVTPEAAVSSGPLSSSKAQSQLKPPCTFPPGTRSI